MSIITPTDYYKANSCQRKRMHNSRSEAKRQAKRHGKNVQAYYCSLCNHWHCGDKKAPPVDSGGA